MIRLLHRILQVAVEGISLLLDRAFRKEYVFQSAVVYFAVGLAVFFLFAEFQPSPMAAWNQFYWIFDKGKDVILWWALTLYVAKNREQRMAGFLMFGIALIRMLCQIAKVLHIITDTNQPTVVFTLFILDLAAMVYIGLSPEIKRKSWRR